MTRSEKSTAIALLLGILTAISIWAAVPGEPFNFLFISDGNLTHDGQAMYADGGLDKVHAQFPPTGNIVIDTDRNVKGKKDPQRRIEFNLSNDLDEPNWHYGHSLSINGAEPGGPSPRQLTELQSIRASVVVHEVFEADGTETPYRLRCNEDVDEDFGYIRVECTTLGASEPGSCTDWRVFAADDGGTSSLKCALYHFVGKGRNAALVRVDENVDYDLAFEALVDLQ